MSRSSRPRDAVSSNAALAYRLDMPSTRFNPHEDTLQPLQLKEALMVAALGPPEKIPSVRCRAGGRDLRRRSMQQLVEHSRVMSGYFDELQAGRPCVQAPGISPGKAFTGAERTRRPVQAFRALTGWLRRAQSEGRPVATSTRWRPRFWGRYAIGRSLRACAANRRRPPQASVTSSVSSISCEMKSEDQTVRGDSLHLEVDACVPGL